MDEMPSICGRCGHTHEARYSRQRMEVEPRRVEPDGTHYVFSAICDWCAREHPELVYHPEAANDPDICDGGPDCPILEGP